jgi:putative phosphoesterase
MKMESLFKTLDALSDNELKQVQDYINQRRQIPSDSVRVGIIADLHGDYQGFLKALEFFEQQGISQILCAGDIVDRGSNADDIVRTFQARNIVCIGGNHDRTVVANQERWRETDKPERLRELGRIVSDETIAYLESLPDTASLTIAGKRILIGHGTPWSDVMTVFPDSRQSTYSRILKEYGADNDIIILGHTHQPLHATIGHLHILNPGSIYGITIRDSHTFATLKLPECEFTVYDTRTGALVPLIISQR